MEMLRRVLILRRIAAANMAAFQAEAEMNPKVAAFQAFLATFRCAWFDVVYVVKMDTGIHLFILQLSIEDKRAPHLLASSDTVSRFVSFCAPSLGTAQFQAAKDSHVDKDDIVIAVRINGRSRAYPIREMAYHHVVNDTVAREPIVSTY
jgi:hypothetical protein